MTAIDLQGQVVLITGAGSGLGREYARAFAARGARVVVNNRVRDGVDKAAAVVSEITAAGGQAIANRDTVATPDGGGAMVRAALDAFGRLDAVVHNAGVLRDRSLAKLQPAELREVMDVHLFGAFHVTTPAFRAMKARGYGRFVFTSSSAGLFGNFGQANYAAAKAAVVGLSHVVAIEGAKYGIAANVVAPLARTGPSAATLGALGEQLEPAHIAPLVLLLSSPACEVTREVFSAGGGHISRVVTARTRGFRAPADGEITPELIASRWPQIMDDQELELPRSVAEELAILAKRLTD